MTSDSTVTKDTAWLVRRIETFTEDELEIIKALVHRMGLGRETYGPWHIDDGRNYPWEALLEVYDALQYCAAELVRLGRVDRNHCGCACSRVNQEKCNPASSQPRCCANHQPNTQKRNGSSEQASCHKGDIK